MNPRQLLLTFALSLGCGSAQHGVGPSQEALVDGTFPPPLELQKRPDKQGRCTLPKGWLPESARVIIRNDACWGEIEATEAECREAAVTNPYNVWSEGRCWYWLTTRRLGLERHGKGGTNKAHQNRRVPSPSVRE